MKRTILSAILLTGAAVAAHAQNITVHGKVLSQTDNEPLMGASVLCEVNKAGAATDLDGNFELTVPEGSILKITYVGFQPVEMKAEPEMTILLSEDTSMLDELVVVGYSTQRKSDLTGSVSVVSTEELHTTSDPDPMRSLQGRIPGVTITGNGSPSGVGTVRIRGIGSFNSSSDPLYIVDGVPTTDGLNSLNMNDIESMQVLKDAASASIYGSRAANGVIIITTKNGRNQGDKIRVDFSANLGAQFYTDESTMDLLDTKGYSTAMIQAALNDGIDPAAYASNYGLSISAPSGVSVRAYDPSTGNYNTYTVNGLYDGFMNRRKTMRFSDTDWLKAISRTGFTQKYDLSVSQAGEKGSMLLSLGYKNNAGIIKYTDFQSVAMRVNTSYNISPVVTVGENVSLSYTSQVDCAPMENALKMAPTLPVYEEDGKTFSGPVGGMSDRQNPLREVYFNRDNRLSIWRIFGNAYVDIKPIEGLVLRSNFGLDYDNSSIRSMNYTFQSDIVNNSTNSTTVGFTTNTRWTWSNTANYAFTLPGDNNVSALVGMEMHRETSNGFSGYNEGYEIENPDYMWPDASTGVERFSGNRNAYALFSLFGKIDWNWRNLLLASFTIRHDGSSRFGKNHRYGTFPAATLGYRLSEHLDKSWLNELKPRFSWGVNGNQAISNTARYSIFVADYGNDRLTSTAYDIFLQQSGIFPSGYIATQTGNDNLKWESTTQYDLGLDFGLFNNRLTGTVDWYVKNVDDMLISPAYLGAMGEGGASWLNGPSLRNWGWEFTLNWRDNLACGLYYDVKFNADFYRNRVTYLPQGTTGSYVHTTAEDLVQSKKPYGSIVGYVCDGIFQNQQEVDASGQENARVGGLRYRDLDGNGYISAEDQTWIYNPVPDFSAGINVDLRYRNFDFSMFWQAVFGYDVYNDQKFQTDFWSITDAGSNKGSRLLDAWRPDNASSTIPSLTTNNTSNEGRTSSYFVESGSFAKLRSLQLGYSLPGSLLSKLRMQSCRFYVNAQNVLTIKSKGYTCSDPENGRWAYPVPFTMAFGVQLSF